MPSRSTLAEATAELAKLTGQTWTVRDLLEYCAQKLIPLQAKVSIEERDIDAVRRRQKNPPIWQNAVGDRMTFAVVQPMDIWMLREDGRAAIKHPADGPRSWPVRNLPVTTDKVVVDAATLLQIRQTWQKEQPHDGHVRLYWSISNSNGRLLGAANRPQAGSVTAETVAPVPKIEGAAAPPDAPLVAEPENEQPQWTLTKPRRFQGYTEPLYLLLEAAHIAGQPIPTPREVLQVFAKEQPSQIASVTGGESLNYYLADGTTIKTANLKAIREVIAGMTGKSQNSAA